MVVFQSPSGVLGVCRGCDVVTTRMFARHVSVPFRGFRGLQEEVFALWAVDTRVVSVPFRGFRGLQAEQSLRQSTVNTGFSPLPGF